MRDLADNVVIICSIENIDQRDWSTRGSGITTLPSSERLELSVEVRMCSLL